MWKWIPAFAALVLASNALTLGAQEERVVTRFGTLSLGEEETVLLNGHPLPQPLKGNSGVDLGQPISLGATDVVLYTDIGGTACPYLYAFVTTSQSGAKTSTCFGTCNKAISIRRRGDSILLTAHGYRGPFEPEAEKRKAEAETHIFVYRNGVVNENGKPVPENYSECQ